MNVLKQHVLFAAIALLSVKCCRPVEIDRVFVSGAADTVQFFSGGPSQTTADDGGWDPSRSTSSVKHHQLVCFQRAGTSPYAASIAEGREKCCFELYQHGLMGRDGRKYCADRVAAVPYASGKDKGSVFPAFYLASDEKEPSQSDGDQNRRRYSQYRSLKVYEDNERETLRDGHNGVAASSPFHLTGFMNGGVDAGTTLPMRGGVEGKLSSEGGMHRAFRQRMHLFIGDPSSGGGGGDDAAAHRVNINATIFLSISEGVFIDADDPLLLEYESSSPEGISCKVSAAGDDVASLALGGYRPMCSIQFIHPETIDIEQPSFASRQYVVAYQVSASLDVATAPNPGRELEVIVDYGTTLHIRYQSPISGVSDDGLVPVVIQQPVLYSAHLSLESSRGRLLYGLHTDPGSDGIDLTNTISIDPIVVRVAAGVDGDYWWITAMTMSFALIGGFVMMQSLDSVSTWC